MTQFEIFIFSCMNFGLLMALIIWSLRKVARQFLYARRATLKKQMVTAAFERRQARAKLTESRRQAARLDADVEERKKIMDESCKEECDLMLESARHQASRIMEAAGRQIIDERAQAIAEVKRRMLEAAFVRAEVMLRKDSAAAARREDLERGLSSLPELLAGVKGLPATGGRQ